MSFARNLQYEIYFISRLTSRGQLFAFDNPDWEIFRKIGLKNEIPAFAGMTFVFSLILIKNYILL